MNPAVSKTMYGLRAAQSHYHHKSSTIEQIAEFASDGDVREGLPLAEAAGLVEPRQHSQTPEVRWAITRQGFQWLSKAPEARPIRIQLDGLTGAEVVFSRARDLGHLVIEVSDGVEKVGETVLTDDELRSLVRMAGMSVSA